MVVRFPKYRTRKTGPDARHRRGGLGLCALALLCYSVCAQTPDTSRSTDGRRVLGPFRPSPCLAVYLLVDRPAVQTRLRVEADSAGAGRDCRVMARVFDPEERLHLRRYIEAADPQEFEGVPRHPDVTLLPRDRLDSGNGVLVNAPLTFDRPGVWQVRLSTGGRAVRVTIDIPSIVGYGVSFQNGTFSGWRGAPKEFFIWVPPHAEHLDVRGRGVRIADSAGRLLADLSTEADSAQTLPVRRTDVAWRVTCAAPDWRFRAAGFPVILCPRRETARELRASVEMLPDGTVVCHKFQRRIAALLPQVLARTGEADRLVRRLDDHGVRRDAWLADPLRNALFTDSFIAAVDKWLHTQNLDPDSHWAGALDGWQEKVRLDPPANRWDRLCSVKGLYAGASNHYGAAVEHLARAALYKSPINPYFGETELLFRGAAAAMRDLMVLGEDEVWRGVGADLDPYPGHMAFALGQKTLRGYALIAPHMPPDVQRVWTEALEHVVDRHYPDYLTSARNQSSHYLPAFELMAEGSGDPFYHTLARLFARRFALSANPAGWFMEATGPDGSYIGMTHWHLAVYYHLTHDPVILDAVRRSYRFFNYTVAPEPDGRMLGGFNFNHRVGEGFYFEQWGGAKGIMDGDCPEVGLWRRYDQRFGNDPGEAKRRAAEFIRKFLESPRHPLYADIYTVRALARTSTPDLSGVLPALTPEPFARNIADQLIAVKTLRYYAVCYIGKPAAGDFYIRGRAALRRPLPDDAENRGGVVNMRKITPFLGGGLSLFWTPEYGSALLAGNWTPVVHHGLVAANSNGERWWEDYFGHRSTFDAARRELSIRGVIERTPIHYERIYVFADDALDVTLRLRASAAVRLARLIENLPFARGGWKSRGAEIRTGDVTDGDATASAVRITDRMGAGIEIIFDSPRRLRLVPNGPRTGGWRKLQIGRIEVQVPREWAEGDEHVLHYVLRPLR